MSPSCPASLPGSEPRRPRLHVQPSRRRRGTDPAGEGGDAALLRRRHRPRMRHRASRHPITRAGGSPAGPGRAAQDGGRGTRQRDRIRPHGAAATRQSSPATGNAATVTPPSLPQGSPTTRCWKIRHSTRLRSPTPHLIRTLDQGRARLVPGPVHLRGYLVGTEAVHGPRKFRHRLPTPLAEEERSGEPGKGPAGERETVSSSRRRRQPRQEAWPCTRTTSTSMFPPRTNCSPRSDSTRTRSARFATKREAKWSSAASRANRGGGREDFRLPNFIIHTTT